MKKITFICCLLAALFLQACREDFTFETSTGNLEFSKNTVYLDTVFTNIGSSTYRLKVYNRSNKDISIPNIRLARGESSDYRLMVDGMAGKSFNNVELLAKDSLFIFIETTIDYNQYQNQTAEYLYTDQIAFDYGANLQTVDLVTLVKDAYFLYPQKYDDNSYEHVIIDDDPIYGFMLDANDAVNGNELLWKNDKPYVIYGYAVVPTEKQLVVEAGAQVHFHYNSGLIVAYDADLQINGEVSAPVIFESDRLEPSFSAIPGQWGSVWLTSGSTARINNAIIKNATVGLLIEDNAETVHLYNVQLYNHTHYGILAQHATITGENVVTNNLGVAAVYLNQGGTYVFNHCTFANLGAPGQTTCLAMNNGDGSTNSALIKATFNNSIFYGSTGTSLIFQKVGNDTFNYYFANNLIRFSDTGQAAQNSLYPIINTTNYLNNIIAKNLTVVPDFTNAADNKLQIKSQSAAIGISNNLPNSGFDILGNPRPTQNADAGAYNAKI
ncbi:hypothetical protein K5I29_05575 [Flavobacterium agricola]|uniref:Right handed beta helix region n=1 Tax=Flavobacterium agricola TaxID=2870839 RepID=A0ABY6M3L7_9FLAO|nr:hypothetical protein [Flavobacterium agricola]UYW02364.1 hypothetical protein K5I29_05575 [Flavobacterium agricola]